MTQSDDFDRHWEADEYSQGDPERVYQSVAVPASQSVVIRGEPKEKKIYERRGSKGDRKAQAARYYRKNRSKLLEKSRVQYTRRKLY